jgi:hypothetical protein
LKLNSQDQLLLMVVMLSMEQCNAS